MGGDQVEQPVLGKERSSFRGDGPGRVRGRIVPRGFAPQCERPTDAQDRTQCIRSQRSRPSSTPCVRNLSEFSWGHERRRASDTSPASQPPGRIPVFHSTRGLALRTARSPPVASHLLSPGRSDFQRQAAEPLPEEDFHLSNQTHSQAHQGGHRPPHKWEREYAWGAICNSSCTF